MSTAILSQAYLKQVAVETLAQADLPTGHTNAIVGTVDSTGAQVLASFKLGADNHWTATGVAKHEWSGDNQVGASVVYSW